MSKSPQEAEEHIVEVIQKNGKRELAMHFWQFAAMAITVAFSAGVIWTTLNGDITTAQEDITELKQDAEEDHEALEDLATEQRIIKDDVEDIEETVDKIDQKLDRLLEDY